MLPNEVGANQRLQIAEVVAVGRRGQQEVRHGEKAIGQTCVDCARFRARSGIEAHEIVGNEIRLIGMHQEPLQPVLAPEVVGIEQGRPCTARDLKAGIAGSRRAHVARLSQDMHPCISRKSPFNFRRGPVRRSIIDDDDFDRYVLLRERTLHRMYDAVLRVETRNDNGHQWICH